MDTTSNTVGLLPSNGIQNNASSKFPTKAPSSTVCNLNGSMTKNVVSGQNPRQVPTAMFGGGRRQWWNLCFVYGDQTKYYRQLYGKRTPIRRLQHLKQQQQQSQQQINKHEDKCLRCGEQFEQLQ